MTPDVRRVTDQELMGDMVTIQARVWDEDRTWLGRQLAQELRHAPDRLGVYVAYDEGVPASAAWIRLPSGSPFGSLWGGATIPGHRSRGLYSALPAARKKRERVPGHIAPAPT